MKISILMPTLNEEKGVGKTIDSINTDFFKQKKWEYEIIIIDGASKDKTREIAESMGAKVIVEKQRGYGRAYKTGLKQTTGDIIVTGDADATYPFNQIHRYIQILLDEKLDFITTDRFADLRHGSMSVKHYLGNWVLATTLRILFFIGIRDSQSGMWIFRRDALERIQPLEEFSDGMAFSEEIKIEMFTNKHVRTREIPSRLYAREGHKKLESFRDGWKNFKFLFRKRVK